MHFERDLQVRLNQRYRRLYKTDGNGYDREIGYFRQFVLSSPALRSIVDSLSRLEPDLDPEQWIKDNFNLRGYDWPDSEAGRAKVVWCLINQWADGKAEAWQAGNSFSSESNINAILRDVTEQAIEPFVEYLHEKLGTESEILYLLERFKRRVEAFDQDELYAAYVKDTARGENIYDRHLRKFLFDQGVDYPFSQPQSASGKADVVSDVHTDDPLVCEVKLYDASQYGVPYVAKGLSQAVSYAHDYGKTVAHLVVFDLSDKGIQVPTDEDVRSWPPRLHVNGVTVYIVIVKAKPLPPASERKKAAPRVVRRDELVGQQ